MTHLQLLSDSTAEAVAGGINIGSISGTNVFSGFAANATNTPVTTGGINVNNLQGYTQFAEFSVLKLA